MILGGDIGGTKTLLGLFPDSGHTEPAVFQASYPSREHDSLQTILDIFLSAAGDPSVAVGCFAVAGPVVDGRCQTTNLPWVLDETELADHIRASRVKLLNDLEGTAYGMLQLLPEDLAVLQEGRRPARQGNVAVIAAGTGLGEAYLFWDGEQHQSIASEGGHADFAPRNETEMELLVYLRGKLGGRVSYERVLSGPGLHEVYLFLRDTARFAEPRWLAERVAARDPSAAISQAAAETGDPLCVATLNLFCEIYGAEAGNMALRALTHGGVYLGGGVAPKNLAFLSNGSFARGFLDKGRFSGLLRELDVWVSLNHETALRGAVAYARRMIPA